MTVKLAWDYSADPPANFNVWYGFTYSSGPIAGYLDKFTTVPGTQKTATLDFPTSNQRVFLVKAVAANGAESDGSNQVVYPGSNPIIVPTPTPTP
jgi:hypothetical protein